MEKEGFKKLKDIKNEIVNNNSNYCLQSDFLRKYEDAIIDTITSNKDNYLDKIGNILIISLILLFFSIAISFISLAFIPLIPIIYISYRCLINKTKKDFSLNIKTIESYKTEIDNLIKEKHESLCKKIQNNKTIDETLEKKYDKAMKIIEQFINGDVKKVKIDEETLLILTEILNNELNTQETDINILLKDIKTFYKNKNTDIKKLSKKYEYTENDNIIVHKN